MSQWSYWRHTGKVMNSGTDYQVGDVLDVTGTATTTGFSQATLRVDNIHNNIGDTLRVSGVTSTSYEGYNGLYRITGITTNNAIEVESVFAVNNPSVTGVGVTLTENAFNHVTGKTLDITALITQILQVLVPSQRTGSWFET